MHGRAQAGCQFAQHLALLWGDGHQSVTLHDVQHLELRARARRDPRGAAHQRLGFRPAGDRDDHPFAGLPGVGDVLVGAVLGQCGIDLIGQPQQRKLPQRRQVAGPKVVVQRCVDAVTAEHIAVSDPAPQCFRGDVHQLDLVGRAHDLVGDALLLGDAGDMTDDIVQALQVLDVDGADDRDARIEELLDILPAMGVAAARGVGVGQLVDQDDLGPPRQHRLDVDFGVPGALVLDDDRRDHLDTGELLGGVAAAVRLDHRGHDIGAAAHPALRLAEHRVRLADAGRGTQVDAQIRAFTTKDAHPPIIPRGATPGSGIPSPPR